MRATSDFKRDSAKQAKEFTKLFSEKLKEQYGGSGFASTELLANELKENLSEVRKDTINSYMREDSPVPSLFNASALSKKLNFSLDELRDSYFIFEPTAETVHGKLLEYYRLYLDVIKIFPQLSNHDYYSDVPCFVEFLKKIEGISDIEIIDAIAKNFEKNYFLLNALIVSKEDLKNDFIKTWFNHYYPCGGRDKKTALEDHFNKLCEKYTDMNDLCVQLRRNPSYELSLIDP